MRTWCSPKNRMKTARKGFGILTHFNIAHHSRDAISRGSPHVRNLPQIVDGTFREGTTYSNNWRSRVSPINSQQKQRLRTAEFVCRSDVQNQLRRRVLSTNEGNELTKRRLPASISKLWPLALSFDSIERKFKIRRSWWILHRNS